jgi:preprotein translocase subunit SecF
MIRPPERGIDLVGPRKWLFLGSGALVLISLVVLAIPPAFRPGIEFTSGTTAHLRFEDSVDQTALRTAYAELGHPEARIQSTGSNEFLIRTSELEVPEGAFTSPEPTAEATPGVGPAPVEPIGTVVIGAADAEGEVLLRRPFQNDPCTFGAIAGRFEAGTEASLLQRVPCESGFHFQVLVDGTLGWITQTDTHDFVEAPAEEQPPPDPEELGERAVIEIYLQEQFGNFETLEFSSVSAVVSATAVRNATVAVVVASLFIMAYIVYAFSGMPRPFRYGAAAIIAMLHDVIIVLGAFSLFGKVLGTEVNLMFVTALLTVIGFSVHDTIVTFDRIRENVRYAPNAPFADNVNAAILQTLARSMNTSLTLLLTVLALLLLGGVTLQAFLLTILIGVTAGVYSSLAIAAQLLVAWEEGDFRRFMFWKRDDPDATPAEA